MLKSGYHSLTQQAYPVDVILSQTHSVVFSQSSSVISKMPAPFMPISIFITKMIHTTHFATDSKINHLTPNGHYMGRTAQLTSRCCILYRCHRRNGPNFGRVFLMLNYEYTDITQNTYIQSWTVTEIMAREKCGHLAFPRNVRLQLCSALTVRLWRHKLRPKR